jgi:hypothetical protein
MTDFYMTSTQPTSLADFNKIRAENEELRADAISLQLQLKLVLGNAAKEKDAALAAQQAEFDEYRAGVVRHHRQLGQGIPTPHRAAPIALRA